MRIIRAIAALLGGRLGCGLVDYTPLSAGDAGTSLDAAGALLDCPSGYVAIAGSPALGTGHFCVMRFEAKAWLDDGDGTVDDAEIVATGCDPGCTDSSFSATHLPASVATGQPWRFATQVVARDRCLSLGDGFDLLSNPEWMTIARELEGVGANWSGGSPGMGRLIEGNTSGDELLAVSDVSDGYDGTAFDSPGPSDEGWEQRRTFVLEDGSRLWDLAGNTQEWIDWSLAPGLEAAPMCTGSPQELPTVVCPGLQRDDFDSSTGTYDSDQGVGMFIDGDGGAARRGGQIGDASIDIAGIYALNVNRPPSFSANATGFRCVWRPPGD